MKPFYALKSLCLLSALLLSTTSWGQLSGDWEQQKSTANPGTIDHGNGVIQLLDTNQTGCQSASVHRMNAYDLTQGAFEECFQTFFGCPGNDEIGSDTKGDGMAFSFWEGTIDQYNMSDPENCGGGLGYHLARDKMVTVEFDTYMSIADTNHDPLYEGTGIEDQIAIHVDGQSHIAGRIAGVNPGNLEDGQEHEVCIRYDPATGRLNVQLDDNLLLSHDLSTTSHDFASYFNTNLLNITWSSGKHGATNPTTVTDGADISKNVGSLCADPLALLEADQLTFCPTDSVKLSAYSRGVNHSYEWFLNGVSLGPETLADTVRYTQQPGTYSILVDDGAGSAVSNEIELVMLQAPELVVTDPAPVCDPMTVDITASWEDVNPATAGLGTVTYWEDPTTSITPINGTDLQMGTYYILKQVNGCVDTAAVEVIVHPTPQLTATSPDPVPGPTTVDITTTWTDNNPATTVTPVTYWMDANATVPVDDPAAIGASGTYYIQKTTAAGCTDMVAVEVIITLDQPDLVARDTAGCGPMTIDLAALWSDQNNAPGTFAYFLDPEHTQPIANPTAIQTSGRYHLRKVSPGGQDTISFVVEIHDSPVLIGNGPIEQCAPETVDIALDPDVWTDSNPATQGLGTVQYWTGDTTTALTIDQASAIGQTAVYFIQKTTPEGCQSIVQIPVTIHNQPQAMADPVQVCAGQPAVGTASGGTTYQWEPANLVDNPTSNTVRFTTDQSTSFTVTVLDENGCSDQTEVPVTFYPLPILTGNSGTICQGESITLIASGANNYVWSDELGNGPEVAVVPETSIVYAVTGTDVNGCSSEVEVEVQVIPIPQVVLSPNANICHGGEIDLYAIGADTYNWAPSLGLSTATGSMVTAAPASTTTFTVIGTTSGCSSSSSVTVNVSEEPLVEITPDTAICQGDSVELVASMADTYTWFPQNGVLVNRGDRVLIQPTETTTYEVTASNAGCPNEVSASVTVTVHELMQFEVTSTSVCAGSSATLVVTGDEGTFTWSEGAGGSLGQGSTMSFSPEKTTNYLVVGENEFGCVGQVTGQVEVLPLPEIDVIGGTICQGDSFELRAVGAVTYLWPMNTTEGATAIVAPLNTESYTVTGVGDNGCTAQDEGTVVVWPHVQAEVSEDITVCPGTRVGLSAAGGSDFVWSNGQNQASIDVFPGQDQTYSVTITAPEMCPATDSVAVKVFPTHVDVYVPNAFTPNGDAVNDEFNVVINHPEHIQEFDVYVFNRWGDRIYHWDHPLGAWSGGYKGTLVKADVYNYIVKIVDRCNNEFADRGKVTLVR